MSVINVRLASRQTLPNLDDAKRVLLRDLPIDPNDVEVESDPSCHGFFLSPRPLDDEDAQADLDDEFDDCVERILERCLDRGWSARSSLLAA